MTHAHMEQYAKNMMHQKYIQYVSFIAEGDAYTKGPVAKLDCYHFRRVGKRTKSMIE